MSTQVVSLVAGPAGDPILSEDIAAAAGILPGHLVEEGAADVAVHAGAGLNAQRLFAQKKLTASGDIDTAYLNGELVSYGAYHSGQEVRALLAASAAAIVRGDPLESDGDGTLRVLTTDTATDDTQRDSVVGYALEAVDNSGGGTVVKIDIRVA